MPGSLTCGFFWSRLRGKCSRHSRRMCNPRLSRRVMCSSVVYCKVLCSAVRLCRRSPGSWRDLMELIDWPLKLDIEQPGIVLNLFVSERKLTSSDSMEWKSNFHLTLWTSNYPFMLGLFYVSKLGPLFSEEICHYCVMCDTDLWALFLACWTEIGDG